MNREMRRLQSRLAAQAAAKGRAPRIGGLPAISNCLPLTEEEVARLSLEARMSWHRVCSGEGTTTDFDNLVFALNTTRVRAERVSDELVGIVYEGQMALLEIRNRYLRIGKFGADADALQKIPPVLDLHDEFLRHSTPAQMARAVATAIRRMEKNKAAAAQ